MNSNIILACCVSVKDVPRAAGCAAGQEVVPDWENQTSGAEDPPPAEPAALRYREAQGYCRVCQKGPGQGGRG